MRLLIYFNFTTPLGQLSFRWLVIPPNVRLSNSICVYQALTDVGLILFPKLKSNN